MKKRDKTTVQLAASRSILEPARRRVADLLRTRPEGYWTIDEVAKQVRSHRTVAFDHLEALVRAGVATKVSVRGARGRPLNAYRYSGSTIEISYPPRRNALLAEILARSAGTGRLPRAVAREIGATLPGLGSLGDDYAVTGDVVHAETCVFGSVCEQSRDVVCGVHAGLIEGALDRGNRTLEVTALGPDGCGGCRFQLHSN